MHHKSEKTLTKEQITERQSSLIEQFTNLVGNSTKIQKSLIIANSGYIQSMQDQDDCFNQTMSEVNSDVYLVCAFLDYLTNPEKTSSLLDIHDLFSSDLPQSINQSHHE